MSLFKEEIYNFQSIKNHAMSIVFSRDINRLEFIEKKRDVSGGKYSSFDKRLI